MKVHYICIGASWSNLDLATKAIHKQDRDTVTHALLRG